MDGINVTWAVDQLNLFIYLAGYDDHRSGQPDEGPRCFTEAEIAEQAQMIEPIVARMLPKWRSDIPGDDHFRWEQLSEAAARARVLLTRGKELEENLGDSAPVLHVSSLHPWIWSSARSLWQSGHFRSAVEDAAKKVNAETQNKIVRRDASEIDLFKQAFTLDKAQPGKSRLRRMPDDGSDTYKSVQRGAMALAEGIYAGIRNPLSHEAGHDLDEQVALEYLAALSVLARWVDESTVEQAEGAS